MGDDAVDSDIRRLARKRVVVTGGSGFLGSHVVDLLRRNGGEPLVPRSRDYDLTDRAATARMFDDLAPHVVLHLAARVGGIEANRRSPGTFFHDNMAMGLHVLEVARQRGTEKVLVTGTICAYPKFAPVPFREEDLWNGYPEETNAPYGIAKKAILVMAQSYRQQFGSNFVMVFPVNLFGPRDNFDLETSHVIPAMIRKFVEGAARGAPTVKLWGDGTPTREFLYVADAADGLVRAAASYDAPEPVNLGAGFEISMRELATKIALETGYRGEIQWDVSRPNGQPRRKLDVTRAAELFGFRAGTSLDEGLAQTIAWYRSTRVGSVEHGDGVAT
jgi:GDP-L-fucose synthase